jgi:hypothetical protein
MLQRAPGLGTVKALVKKGTGQHRGPRRKDIINQSSSWTPDAAPRRPLHSSPVKAPKNRPLPPLPFKDIINQSSSSTPDAVEERVRRLAGGNFLVPGVVPQTPSPFEARQFDMGSDDVQPFEPRQFDQSELDADQAIYEAAMAVIFGEQWAATMIGSAEHLGEAPADVAPSVDLNDNSWSPGGTHSAPGGIVPVEGNPYLEWLVDKYSNAPSLQKRIQPGQIANLQAIAGKDHEGRTDFWT